MTVAVDGLRNQLGCEAKLLSSLILSGFFYRRTRYAIISICLYGWPNIFVIKKPVKTKLENVISISIFFVSFRFVFIFQVLEGKARKLLEMESTAGPGGHGMAAGSKKAMPRMGISSGAIHPNLQHLRVTDNLLNLTERSSFGLLPAQALQVTVGPVQHINIMGIRKIF